jgi:hypothetical protein
MRFLAVLPLLFLGCGSDSLVLEQNSSSNPYYYIYDENCLQDANTSLCGYKGGTFGNMPFLPASIVQCEDKENCQ